MTNQWKLIRMRKGSFDSNWKKGNESTKGNRRKENERAMITCLVQIRIEIKFQLFPLFFDIWEKSKRKE